MGIRPSLNSCVPAVRQSQSPSPPRRHADLSWEDGLLRLGCRRRTVLLLSQRVASRLVRNKKATKQLHVAHESLALCSNMDLLAAG
jgi:hypothetical protein